MTLALLTPVKEVTVGADPEVFFVTKERLVYPACGLIGGTKENPIPVRKGALQEDNVMAEFNIDPSSDVEEFMDNITIVYEELSRRAAVKGYNISQRASANFPMFLLQEHKQALEFGCLPDFNAYTLEENSTPDVNSTLRTCAGHVHLGFKATTDNYMKMAGKVVEYLDWIVGLWTVTKDPDTVRRERYGKAGAFRPKEYGLEYRVPSNFWLNSESLKRTMFERVKLAYGLAAANSEKPSFDRVQDAINTHDVAECNRLLGGYVL